MSLPVTLWLKPGNSQLLEMLSCASNQYSTGMCLGRPEHSCLPNRRAALPPALPQHCCPRTRLVRRPCVRGSRPWPCPRSLAQEALRPGQAPAAEPILLGSQAEEGGDAGTEDAQEASDPGSSGPNSLRQEVLLGTGPSPDTPLVLSREGEGKRRGQGLRPWTRAAVTPGLKFSILSQEQCASHLQGTHPECKYIYRGSQKDVYTF